MKLSGVGRGGRGGTTDAIFDCTFVENALVSIDHKMVEAGLPWPPLSQPQL